MENTLKPIKRCKELAALSREHHDGLLFVWKLRQGLNNLTDIQTLRRFCNFFFRYHMIPHFYHEEGILLKFLPKDHQLAIQLLTEHNDIREIMTSIDRLADADTIVMLADFIERHIRFEERVLFNYLEKTLSKAQLDHIQSQLGNAPISSYEWKEDFWSKKLTSQKAI